MIMKPTMLKPTLFLFLIGSVAAFGSTEEKLDHRFSVQSGGTVVVDVDFGSVNVSTNATDEVVVDVWRKIGRRKKADEEAFLRDHPVTFTQDGNTVTVQSRGERGRSWFGGGRTQNEAKYTISVPARFSARLKTGGGGVDVADLTGEVRADTGGGGLSFVRLHGSLAGKTGGGGIKVAACEGTITLRTGGGGFEVAGGGGTLDGHCGWRLGYREGLPGVGARQYRRRRGDNRKGGRGGGGFDRRRFHQGGAALRRCRTQ